MRWLSFSGLRRAVQRPIGAENFYRPAGQPGRPLAPRSSFLGPRRQCARPGVTSGKGEPVFRWRRLEQSDLWRVLAADDKLGPLLATFSAATCASATSSM